MKPLFICFLFFYLWNSSAQQIVVVDETNSEPIAGVAVFNLFKTKTDISDFDGKASLVRFQSFERVYFQHISYHKESMLKSKVSDTIFLSPKSTDLNEIVISASKFEQTRKEVPQKIISINSQDIQRSSPQTAADLLANSGRVFVQKSQLGGGSPMIRGFSTNRVLITVDGVRLNNAIFRGGNIQNVISINPFNVQNTEVILGAGSVIYGSDAIGGVMNFYTTTPEFSKGDMPDVSTKSNLRYSTANAERTVQLGLNLGLKKWGFHTNISFSDFDDLKMGKTDIKEYLTPFYVTQRNNQDILMPNHNPRTQKYTGFSQLHLAQKAVFKPSETLTFDFGLHYTTTSNIPRYDRLVIQNSDNSLKYAEWDYGPQQWLLANFQVTKLSSRSNFYDKIKTTLAYQYFGESRISRKFESVSRKSRAEKVRALSLNLDFDKSLTDKTNLSYGAEYIYNKVGSEAASINIDNNTIESIAPRYPDGSEWSSLAAYLSFKYKPIEKLTLQSGIRYNSILIKTDLSSNAQFYELPFYDTSLNTSALTGTAGLTWEQSKTFLWKLNATTAFRAPNIDDIGKVFDSQPGLVVAPNPHLSPEHAYGGELGLTINIDDSVLLDFSTYYTYLDNAMVRNNFSINGVSEIEYDGELSEVQAIQNTSEAWVTGFEAGLRARLSKALEITSQYSVSNGRQKNAQNIDSPMRHVAPAFGNMHVIWKHNKTTLDGYINYNAGLSYEDISHELSKHLFALDENVNPYAPAWLTFNLRSQYNFSKTVSFVGAIENITNKGYRPFASGISGPGTNLIFAITYQN
ncbi:MAG: TonB-dependent receptor [Bacteroidetes bacterium]|nr:TonB-dependent receptor [Bacteroidota bacterium]MDA0860203.1 TonB-dependent receptor [Bacteroidota bacterium]MDA1319055.1 TonB-dependent receptor [Bacteroidota bacterium]